LLRDRSDDVRSSPPTRLRATSSWSTTRNPGRVPLRTRVSKADARIDLLFTMSDSGVSAKPMGLGATQTDKSRTITLPGWWSQTGSNRRPPACKAGALPTELWPRRRSRDQTVTRSSRIEAPFRALDVSDPRGLRPARRVGTPFRLDPWIPIISLESEKSSHKS
jgi:hypothetical protein